MESPQGLSGKFVHSRSFGNLTFRFYCTPLITLATSLGQIFQTTLWTFHRLYQNLGFKNLRLGFGCTDLVFTPRQFQRLYILGKSEPWILRLSVGRFWNCPITFGTSLGKRVCFLPETMELIWILIILKKCMSPSGGGTMWIRLFCLIWALLMLFWPF